MSAAIDTPLMKQYQSIKARYPGAMLLFRVGDFYETFGQDAVAASKALGIVLTKRGNGSASEIELAGFPHHALDSYLPKLIRAGHRVAICDQLEDPKMVKGIVKRGVTELITPGISIHDQVLERKQNNFLACVYEGVAEWGISLLDFSTGEFYCAQGTQDYVWKLIQSLQPSEIIFSKTQQKKLDAVLSDDYATFSLDDWAFDFSFAEEKLTRQFHTTTLRGFGIDIYKEAVVAAGALLQYLENTEHTQLQHLRAPSRLDESKYVWLDKFTLRNLELFHAQHEDGIPLIHVLDQTITPMGSRTMRQWLALPLLDKEAIEERHRLVQQLSDDALAQAITESLQKIYDLERLISKAAVGRINPREMTQLKKSLVAIQQIKITLSTQSDALKKISAQLDSCEYLAKKIDDELNEDAPMAIHQGNLIKTGINAQVDEWRHMAYSGKDYLLDMQKREAEKTGISSLKISYNKVFGYYLEVSHTHRSKVPPEWIRKQTLTNAERYITEELKVYEEKILQAEEKLFVIEQQLYQDLVRCCTDFISTIQQNARLIGSLDTLLSFARVARKNNYVQPVMNESTALVIKNGRHPVIEQQLPPGEKYVPNDCTLDTEQQQILIITGPNMAGKSALLRQTALIALMAQIGSFVPASEATIGLLDKIFTRVGASDNLSRGESTFMVEMTETASILNNISNRSLILMDEIGRGTSTYDGVSIAWAIVEYIHQHPAYRPKTLFATHYHELNQLAEDFVRVKNFNVSVKEAGDKIIFLRKLKEGGSAHSFGIHVAQMAGIPNQVVLRAQEILKFLESHKHKQPDIKQVPATQFGLFEVDPLTTELHELLKGIDINTLSPVEALLKLNEVLLLVKKR